jgi:hypothetical protein
MENTTVNKIAKNKVLKPIDVEKVQKPFVDNSSDEEYETIEGLILGDFPSRRILDATLIDVVLGNIDLSFEIQQLPYCCGVFEIGFIRSSFLHKETKNDRIYLKQFLDAMLNQYSGTTFIINTNGRTDCKLLEEVLPKCDNWALVKSFKNVNSGNTIKMWISKNA